MTAAWKSMESAPKDGTWVLLTGGDAGGDFDSHAYCVTAQWTHHLNGDELPDGHWQYAWFDGGYYGRYDNPTHWMDLPDPPAEGT